MTYEETMDRCSIIWDTLISGHSIMIEPTLENVEWATMCAESVEKQTGKKPGTVGVVLANCPCCDTMVDKSDFVCRGSRKVDIEEETEEICGKSEGVE